MWLPLGARKSPGRDLVRQVTRLAGKVGVASHLKAVVDAVLPPTCPVCARRIGGGTGLCTDCWQGLRLLEEPWCERTGTPFAYDLGPGALSAGAVADPPRYGRARAAVSYEGSAIELLHQFKYGDRTELAEVIAAQMARAGAELLADCDLILPVPLHPRRLLGRRYNQAALIAAILGRQAGVPVAMLALRRVRATRSQVGLSAEGREANLAGAFAVHPRAVRRLMKARLLLVDDVFTTGATVDAATRVLLRAGAAQVDVLTFARVVPAG